MKFTTLSIAVSSFVLAGFVNAQEMTQLSCKDFNPTPEAMERFPDLKNACQGIVERNGELYGLFPAEVRRVRGNNVTLHLPATNHTFTVRPDPAVRVMAGDKKIRPRELMPTQKIRIYLAISEFAKPDIEQVAFVTESDFLIDVPVDAESSVEIPGRVMTTTARDEVIVEAVNRETREIKVIDAEGRRYSFTASDMVKNFDQIEPRDRIVMDYLESVAVFIAPAGAPSLPDAGTVEVAPPGAKPGVAAADTYMVSAKIEAIDTENRALMLSSDEGEMQSIKVADGVPMDTFKVGDEVRMRVTEAIAISVVKPN